MTDLEKTKQIFLNYREIKNIYDNSTNDSEKKQSEMYLAIINKYLNKLKISNEYFSKNKYSRCKSKEYMQMIHDVLCYYYISPKKNSFAAVTKLINNKYNTSYSSATIAHFHNAALKIISEYFKEDDVI